jgi:hypothetical protein
MRHPSATALISPKLEDRVPLTAHDFFDPQTVSAGGYLFRWIFHNWGDADAVKILQALVSALKLGVRILINDGILPEGVCRSNGRERDQISKRSRARK